MKYSELVIVSNLQVHLVNDGISVHLQCVLFYFLMTGSSLQVHWYHLWDWFYDTHSLSLTKTLFVVYWSWKCFSFCVWFWFTPSDVQGLLVALHQGITPGSAGGGGAQYEMLRIKPRSAVCKISTLPCTITTSQGLLWG